MKEQSIILSEISDIVSKINKVKSMYDDTTDNLSTEMTLEYISGLLDRGTRDQSCSEQDTCETTSHCSNQQQDIAFHKNPEETRPQISQRNNPNKTSPCWVNHQQQIRALLTYPVYNINHIITSHVIPKFQYTQGGRY